MKFILGTFISRLGIGLLFLISSAGLAYEEAPTVSQKEQEQEIGAAFVRLREAIKIEGEEAEHHPSDAKDDQAHGPQGALDDHSDNVIEDDLAEHESQESSDMIVLTEPNPEVGELSGDARSPFTTDIERADYLQQHGKYAEAINTYVNLLNIVDVPEAEHKRALFGLAETYFRRGSLSQSVSLLHQFVNLFPEDERRQECLFQIGLIYREMKLHSEAVTAFYRVLNSIVVTGEADLPKYLKLARRSQFEIARSHFYAEQWGQALAFIDRIELFELNPRDRESLHFYKAHATLKTDDLETGLELVQKFIHTYPSSPLIPEMLYTKADVLAQMQLDDDAVATLMELLEFGGLPEEEFGEEWNRWRQQAGNQFANRYYDKQDFLAALRLYQGITVLDDRKEWQLPIVFQMGLCFEKLGMYDRAMESMTFVAQGIEDFNETDAPPDAALEQLLKRTQWRLDMLQWRAGIEQERLPMLAKSISDPESEEE